MKSSDRQLLRRYARSLTRAELDTLVGLLAPDEQAFLLGVWDIFAHREQLPPEGDWRTWLFLGGRGAGKTRAGAEWVRTLVADGRARSIALVGATYADVRGVMIEGVSGLLTLGRNDRVLFEPSKRQL